MYLEISNPMDYHVGLYIRLSKEDENEGPSESVNNQRSMLEEFVKQYRDLRFGETNNVIAYFESELERVGNNLRNLEDSLRDYNVQHRVINTTSRPSTSPPSRATTNCATRRSC